MINKIFEVMIIKHINNKKIFILFIIILFVGIVIGVLIQDKTKEEISTSAIEEITVSNQDKNNSKTFRK